MASSIALENEASKNRPNVIAMVEEEEYIPLRRSSGIVRTSRHSTPPRPGRMFLSSDSLPFGDPVIAAKGACGVLKALMVVSLLTALLVYVAQLEAPPQLQATVKSVTKMILKVMAAEDVKKQSAIAMESAMVNRELYSGGELRGMGRPTTTAATTAIRITRMFMSCSPIVHTDRSTASAMVSGAVGSSPSTRRMAGV